MLRARLDAPALMARMLRGDYRGIQSLLGTLFGPVGDERHEQGTNGTAGDTRHLDGPATGRKR